MKFLFDHNLSPRLVDRLADLFPQSVHVYQVDLAEAEDREIWEYAQKLEFIIVTRDSDYNDLIQMRGFPPKIIWIRRGNCSTAEIEDILRRHLQDIQTLEIDPDLGILTLF